MVKVILVNDERCTLEKLAYELGFRWEVAGDFTNLSEAVAKINELKETTPASQGGNSEKEKIAAAYRTTKRPLDNGTVLVLAQAQSSLAEAGELTVPANREQELGTAKLRFATGNAEGIKLLGMTNPERITLWEGQKIVWINAEKVSCCFLQKGQRKVTVVAENKIYQSKYTLNLFLDKFGKNRLIRCHRSFAINPDYLAEILPGENNTMVAKVMGYNRDIPVSRQYSSTLRTIVGLRTRANCKNYPAFNNL